MKNASPNLNGDRTAKNGPPYRKLFLTSCLTLAAAVAALACAFSSATDHSVRFGDRTGRAFYRLPPLPIVVEPKTGKELTVYEVENYDYGYAEDQYSPANTDGPDSNESSDDWEKAKATFDSGGDLIAVRDLLRSFVDKTNLPTPDGDQTAVQAKRNSARDMIDALTAISRDVGSEAVRTYLKARFEYDPLPTFEKLEEIVQQAPRNRNLNDNWAYLRASVLAQTDEAGAIKAFQKLTKDYPESEKLEAALFMEARLTMKESYSSSEETCFIQLRDHYNDELRPAKLAPKNECQDVKWHSALEKFRKLIARFPKGRYANDARGWIANLYVNGEEPALALAEYYRLLGQTTDQAARLQAKKDLQFIGHKWDDQTLDAVERLIGNDANAALAYAYHRIYNHAIDETYSTSDGNYWGPEQWQEKSDEDKRVSDLQKDGDHQLERTAKFATSMLDRHLQAHVTGGFLLRVAEAQLELKNFSDALKLAEKALSLGVQNELRMESLWVKGSSEHQLKQLRSARNTFKQLVGEFPNSKVTEGAKRLLAMTAEDQDDLETALDIYIDLDYKTDVAYFIDVLMPTDRLATYVAARKNNSKYNDLLYGLGVRYMRDKRWNDARIILRQVRTQKGIDGYLEQNPKATWYFPKEPGFDDGELTYVKTSWVMQDLRTIDILEEHEQAVENAQGDENKAEALYQLASCLFESDDLVFYNPAAWRGERAGSLNSLMFSDNTRLPDESRVIFEHLEAHDPWARAIPIYEDIVARYPKTKIAKESLYSIAAAHERLSERNYPWSGVYSRGLFAGSRMVTYADVKSTYPDYQLPRGTYGWKPSTRTVNGGPAYAKAPVTPPRPTRTERAFKFTKALLDQIVPKIETRVDGFVNGYLSLMWTCFYWAFVALGLFTGIQWFIWAREFYINNGDSIRLGIARLYTPGPLSIKPGPKVTKTDVAKTEKAADA